MTSFLTVIVGAASGWLCRRNRMPSAVQPGGKYELEKVSIRTGRPVASSSALDRASRVNGQWVASTMTPVAITPRSMTTLIQSHLGIGRYAAGEDCSMSTWKYKQSECRGPAKKRWAAAKRKDMNSLAPLRERPLKIGRASCRE